MIDPEGKVINDKSFPIPVNLQEIVREQISELLEAGIIQRSFSHFSSPFFVIKKKSLQNASEEDASKVKYRMVIDFRLLNEISLTESGQLLHINYMVNRFKKHFVYSSVDFVFGYYQIPLEQRSRHLIAFRTQYGLMEFTRMPLGLNSASSTLNRHMQFIFPPENSPNITIFLDDILISTATVEEHFQVLRHVFGKLREHNLKLRPKKSKFFQKSLLFLGHRIGQQGVGTDESKQVIIKNLKDFWVLWDFQEDS